MNAISLPLPFDATALAGLSEKLLRSHHENNYGGAVKRLNAIRAELKALPGTGFQLNGLKREELIAANSMLLHELYFDSLGGNRAPMAPAMGLALAASFGSVERWQQEFAAMGKALGGGSGWVLLCFSPREGRLVNQWGADHTHAMAGTVPLLALDMYEHAYHMDYGANAGAYVDAFMALIDWAKVYERYQHAVHAASDGLAADAQRLEGTRLIDVRRAGVFENAQTLIAGAHWRDPATVDAWAHELKEEDAGGIVLYCVYGHEVCRATALRLRAQGIGARFLPGGIDAWQSAGRPLVAKEQSS